MYLRILLSSLHARRSRLLLAGLAVTLGVGVATALGTLALQVGDDLARTLRAAGPNFVALPVGARWPLDLGGSSFQPARAGARLEVDAVTRLKDSFWKNNILAAAPELDVPVTLAGTPATAVGTWFDRDVPGPEGAWRTGLAHLRPLWTVAGRWPREDSDEIAIGRALARRIGAAAGTHVEVALDARHAQMVVTAIVSAGGTEDQTAWMPLARAQMLAGAPGAIDRVWLSALVLPPPRQAAPDRARDPAGYERFMCSAYPGVVATTLTQRLDGAEVLPMTEVVAGEGRVVARLNLLMLMLALAALTAATLGLLSTTAATVVERRVELGLLRAIGAGSNSLASLLLGETALVSVAGGIAGWGLGTLGAWAIRGETFGVHAPIQPLLLPIALALAALLALLGTWAPLHVALRVDPAVVLRGQI